MAVTILDEQIGDVSVIGSVTIETKEVLVTYEVDYNASSYFVDVLVTFREVVATGRRVLYLLKVENHEISLENNIFDREITIYEALLDGLRVRFPALSLSEADEISLELTKSFIKRLNSFGIAINKQLF